MSSWQPPAWIAPWEGSEIMTTRQLAAAGILTLALAGSACTSNRQHMAAETPAPVNVTVATVSVRDQPAAFDAGGVVQPQTMAVLTARILAPVREVRAAAGDRVRAGQVLVVLDAGDLEAHARSAHAAAGAASEGAAATSAEHRAAQAALDLARTTHERVAALHARRSATLQELDEATAALRAADAHAAGAAARMQEAALSVGRAQAASEAAAAAHDFTRITAPFDGIVTEKLVEPGNTATPGMPLLRVEDTRVFRLEVRVDESRATQVSSGAEVAVVLDSGATVTGTVSEVARAVEADARAFLVKITLPAVDGLRSGMFGRARFRAPVRQTLTVPSEAVVRRGQLTTVFVLDGDRARLRLVNLNGSEVLAGLAAGEIVIVNPPPTLADGHPVRAGGL